MFDQIYNDYKVYTYGKWFFKKKNIYFTEISLKL